MAHTHDHIQDNTCGCSCSHEHNNSQVSGWKKYIPAITSLLLLLAGISLDNCVSNTFFEGYVRLAWYLIAYLPVGYPVLKEVFEITLKKDFFNEFSLMSIATLGAFALREYPEGVAVMLFYSIGELFQGAAVDKAKGNIKALLDIRPDSATVLRQGTFRPVKPSEVIVGELIQIKIGEKVPLDGILVSEKSSFNTSALTGESRPKTLRAGEIVLAGMLNLDTVVEMKVEKKYEDSSLAKILELVQNAISRKSKTELFIRKFARIYTPVVFFLALSITLIPYFIVSDYHFATWLYRALVFLVISCPCALVISIPLGYFGGIGAASRNGILFKGANYLDILTRVNTVVMDKTGTLTQGVFEVQEVYSVKQDADELLYYVAALEQHSNHPIAKAITSNAPNSQKDNGYAAREIKEIAGYGLEGVVNDKKVLVGNTRLLDVNGIEYDKKIDSIVETLLAVAVDNAYLGYITIADKEKPDAKSAIQNMRKQGINQTVILSGDKTAITQKLAVKLDINISLGNLLPQDKVMYIETLKQDKTKVVAFVGDGINDSPALALSDVGIAMGGLGSDAAIEVADVIIQTDEPSKIATAIQIAKATRSIVFQNITLAFTIKVAVLILGAGGLATMWEAVFADVGVALLAILNAVRILKKDFR